MYDFIIVGGGSAGCVLANRLSEVKEWRILLIEAGTASPVESSIPALDRSVHLGRYDWQYYTQDNGRINRANKNHSVYWPRGKMLGGCSNINGMIYFRGSLHDYQTWYEKGNKDWHPRIVTKCFKKAESLQDQNLLKDPKLKNYYGNNGPLIINTFNSTYRPITERILESWSEIGIPTKTDLNYANVMGAGITRATAFSGRRSSTEYDYLRPVRNRENLHVITETLVTKVLINENQSAYGVQVDRNGYIFNILASREVIISAGTVNTPQLLMLSGIGPKQHLQSKNITCILDLPAVGQNLQDHFLIPITIYGDEPGYYTNEADKHFDVIKYLYNRSGSLAHNSFSDIISFYARNEHAKYPEFQNHFLLMEKNSSDTSMLGSLIANYKDVVVQSMVEQNSKQNLFFFLFGLLHPCSTGQILLNTSDPKQYPLIYPNYLSDRRDIEATVDGIKRLTKIVNTKYFKSINGRLGRLSWPECDDFKLDSEEYWECIAINMVITDYHPMGTAKMGNNARTSVVSSQLKVHHIKNLRVIDASVMPSHISGNINGPVIMIAERGSGLIKRDHGIEQQSGDYCY